MGPFRRSSTLSSLPTKVKAFVEENAKICGPKSIHICDGSFDENEMLTKHMVAEGMLKKLSKLENCYLARTDPRDVARVESKTFIATERKEDTVPTPQPGITGELGNWISPKELQTICDQRFSGAMAGRTMYVIPYSMGPVGSSLSKIGIELTDSPYVVASMRVMTRMGKNVLETLGNADFVRCLHSVGNPFPLKQQLRNNWPCNPDQTFISHIPDRMEIRSFGSGYGGNSLLGKKCFALRLGSVLAKKEGWLAEHMLILGITNPKGEKRYIAAAFPSACGKTNLAMLLPTLPGYKVECVGDDIAWMRFDDKTGELRAINPEAGFFGIAPGTSKSTNPNAYEATRKDTIFTNVAETSDGDIWWEGLPLPENNVKITDWLGNPWSPQTGTPAAHANSRFCTPARNCKSMDLQWEDPNGVPISAIIFGGRRPTGIPLVYEAFDWKHGVFMGACMKSEVTAAAQDVKAKVIRHDPFAMKPFLGYNFGQYVEHWFSMEKPGRKMPRVYHVNWFGKDSETGNFLWPGFSDNLRVLDWIIRRVDGEDCALETPIGNIPTQNSLRTDKIEADYDKLFDISPQFWNQEVEEIEKYMKAQAGSDLPEVFWEQLFNLRKRFDLSISEKRRYSGAQ